MPQEAQSILAVLDGPSQSLTGIAQFLWPELFAVLWFSLVTMVILQWSKDLTPLRRWVQGFLLRRWIERRISHLEPTIAKPNEPKDDGKLHGLDELLEADAVVEVVTKLVKLATAGDRKALFGLTVEQLAGQVSAASQLALDYASDNKALLAILAEGADPKDFNAMTKGVKEGPPPEAADDARIRVDFQIQRTIDKVMISLGNRWRWFLRLLAVLISLFVIVLHLRFVAGATWEIVDDSAEFVVWGSIVLVAGYLAPVLHDILSRLQGGPGRSR